MPAGDLMTEKLHAYRRLDPRALPRRGRRGLRRIELPSGGAIYAAAAENEQVASRDRPIGISLPLGRPLGDIVGAAGVRASARPPTPKKYRRYVWAVLRDIEQPLDATTRVRVFANCHELSPRTRLDRSELCDERQLLRRRARQPLRGAGDRSAGGVSVYVDLTPTLARMDHPREPARRPR